MPLDYEVSDRMREPSLAELGLSPAAVVNVPAFLAEPEPEARYLCDEYAVEWELHDAADLAEQVKDWRARAALEREAVRQRDIMRDELRKILDLADRLNYQLDVEREAKQQLREGMEVVRQTLNECGYTSGALHERIRTMFAEIVRLRQVVSAQSGAVSPRPTPPAAA